ncbi:uncharacterized protein LOC104895826 isoform X2 [Beta vulgaris subsp. vulgaris]|uniref:uncharacterized protein LOC104895826 isoform X2 n=1 Tax=Beta vulgaris subsp. vulgaris TaxID=3555 RepID=UPI00053FC9AD|nr:uncharacterized protein LOC104895826 isoform X2 [Beta vulgaris subsp. vulgaris]
MELDSDLMTTKTLDDLHSTDFRISKDRAGQIFLWRETVTMFIFTAHLRGYKKENIMIDINEDGTLISISGAKMVQEMVMNRWVLQQKEPSVKDFRKVFRIPSAVLLDQIKAGYNDDESTLKIYMPKQNQGIIIGGGIEEVKDEKQVGEGSFQEKQLSEDVDQGEEIRHERDKEEVNDEEVSSIDKIKEEKIVEENVGNGCETEQGEKGDDQNEGEESNNNKCKLFAPCFFIGSTLVASSVMMLVSLIRSKRK